MNVEKRFKWYFSRAQDNLIDDAAYLMSETVLTENDWWDIRTATRTCFGQLDRVKQKYVFEHAQNAQI